MAKTFIVQVTFTVGVAADEHVQTPQAISEEVRSWLESLGAIVKEVEISKAAP